MGTRFRGGRNIAMKVPPHQWEATVAFYRDTLGLPVHPDDPPSEDGQPETVSFEFGPNRLWIDRVETVSRSELWLEVVTTDNDAAAEHLAANGVVRCDEIEPLPADSNAFWIANPTAVVHLVAQEEVTGSEGE